MVDSTRSALEEREARVGPPFIMLMLALLLPSIGTCGGIGAYKAEIATSKVATRSIDDVASESRTPAGTYVDTQAELRFVSQDELPYDGSVVVRAPGAKLFRVVGKPNLVVYCEDERCAGLDAEGARVRLRGQLCKGNERLLCDVPKPLSTYTRNEADHGRPHRVLVAGVTPSANIWQAAVGIGIALACIALVVWTVIAAGRPRKGAHLSVERSVTLRGAWEGARRALERRRSATFRLAEEGPDHVIFLAGAEASSARLTGVKSRSDVARRVEIRFQEQAAYRAVLATITVTEILPFQRGVPKRLRPLVQEALEQTLADVEQLVATGEAQRELVQARALHDGA
jgi:hypothetical protein